jgi:hypothetical protein
MGELIRYAGYGIAVVLSTEAPFTVGYQITTDPPTEGGEVLRGWLPGQFATAAEGTASAIAEGKRRIDELPRRV